MIKKGIKFLTDVRAELRKVTWPTREQTTKQTGVVLAMVAIMAFFLGAIDLGLSELVQLVIK